jgi:hypothetical protein
VLYNVEGNEVVLLIVGRKAGQQADRRREGVPWASRQSP